MHAGKTQGFACNLCGAKTGGDGYNTLPALIFQFLQGTPCVCEMCVAKKLGLKNLKWIDVIEKQITFKK